VLIVSIALLGIFAFGKAKYASIPIMPLGICQVPPFLPLILVVLSSFMSFGTLLWYIIAQQQEIPQWTVLSFGIAWIPFGIFGTLGAILTGWLTPRISAQWILAVGLATVLVSNLLVATMPNQQTYWAEVFLATILWLSA
jgi:hypothetical protein